MWALYCSLLEDPLLWYCTAVGDLKGKSMQQPFPLDVMHWITQTVAMALTVLLLPNLRVTNLFGPILAVAALALVNTTLWSTDLFLQMPGSLSTQAITLVAINGGIFWLIVKLLPGIESKGIFPVVAAPLVFSVLTILIPQFASRIDWDGAKTHGNKLISHVRTYVQNQPPQSEAVKD